jgi:shikimate kinase
MKIAFLMGFRGVGKTTLGKALNGWKNIEFLDLDEEMESEIGETILEFVEKNGLEKFRDLEGQFLEKLLNREPRNPLCIGLGGGIIEGERAWALLKSSAHPKILLEVPVGQLWQRLLPRPDRRKIANLHDFSSFQALFQKREPRYKEIATHRILNQDITQGLNELKKALGSVWQDAL